MASECVDGCKCTGINAESKSAHINFLSNIASTREENLFILPWNNQVILRECDIEGNLIDLKQTKEIIKKGRLDPCVPLTMKPFIDEVSNLQFFGEFR